MANAPDLDFVPGVLVGRPALFHQGITHSISVGLIVSLGVAGFLRIRGRQFAKFFNICFISYLSHLLIDLFGTDKRFPFGIPVLWPLSQEYFISPVPLLWGVHHAVVTSASTSEWINGILNLYNVEAIGLEIVYIGGFALIALALKKGSRLRKNTIKNVWNLRKN
jgi:inner membrane protein